MGAVFFIVIVVVVLRMSSAQDTRIPLQPAPGILLRDLLNSDSPPITGSDDLDGWAGLYTGSESTGGGFLREYDDYESDSDDSATDDLLASLSERGLNIDEPSAHFLLDLYEKLQSGENLAQSSGHTTTGSRHGLDLDQADTVRSYTPKGGSRIVHPNNSAFTQ